jgi:hypothetical protein
MNKDIDRIVLSYTQEYLKSPFEILEILFNGLDSIESISGVSYSRKDITNLNSKLIIQNANKNKFYVYIGLYKKIDFINLIPIGEVIINNLIENDKKYRSSIIFSVDKRFIKRHIFNSSSFDLKRSCRTLENNLKLIEKFPEKIIPSFVKSFLLNSNYSFKLNNFYLKSNFSLILDIDTNKSTINYFIKLEEDLGFRGRTVYIGTSSDSVFGRILKNYLNEKTRELFNKDFNKLNKKELKLIDLYLY